MRGLGSRGLLIGGVAAVAVAIGAGAALAGARDGSPSPRSFVEAVARHLGVSTEKLEAATRAAAIEQVDAALASGLITEEQADELKRGIESGEAPFFGRGPGPGLGFGFGLDHGPHGLVEGMSAVAEYLDLTVAELREKLVAGQSLADVAESQGKSADGLVEVLVDAAEKQLDEAVASGDLTRAQADDLLARLKSHVDELVRMTPPRLGDAEHPLHEAPFPFPSA